MLIKEEEKEGNDEEAGSRVITEGHWYDIFISVIEWKRNFIRAGLCLVALLFAVSIGNITDIVTLNGGICMTMLTFIFPPMIYTKAHWHRGISRAMLVWQVFVFVLGLVIMYVATKLAIKSM
eukprot:GFYU01061746.1.p1 GENE.GFYU01061746.1~~GFYU01061746.1.p1  ORF type:complete len:122 (-),score=28.77 GFYU01061746.1:30-395(-)